MSRSTRSKWPEAAALLAAVLTFAAAAAASTPLASDGSQAPAHVRKYVGDAPLAGAGRLTWYGLHVYDAALYAPARLEPANPTAQGFVLELTYARRLAGKDIAAASRDEIERLGFGTEAQRAR